MRVVVLIDAVTSCPLSLFAPRIPLRRPIGMLRDLCTIIAYAMYTGSNPETIIQTFLVHGHPIAGCFMKRAISFDVRNPYLDDLCDETLRICVHHQSSPVFAPSVWYVQCISIFRGIVCRFKCDFTVRLYISVDVMYKYE